MNTRPETAWVPTLELFCDEFRRGSSYTNWRPRGGGDWLLIYTVAGFGAFVTPAGTMEASRGDAVLYTPRDPQDYGTAPNADYWNLLWVHFTPKPHWQPWLHWPLDPCGLRRLRLDKGELRERFYSSMDRMISASRRQLVSAPDLAANALEEALLWAHVAASKDPWMTMDPRIQNAIEYLVARLREPFSLSAVAHHCGLSVSRLAHLFKEQTGASPQQFIEQHRLQRASQLLRFTNLSIGEVAAEVGYADPFYFSNRFRRRMGKSPSELRSLQRRRT